MVSMSPRWVSEKLCADAPWGRPQSASANRAEASRRNEGICKSSLVNSGFRTAAAGLVHPGCLKCLDWSRRVLVALGRLGDDDIVGLDPSGSADGETGLGAGGQFARGLVVAAQIGGLGRGQIGLRVISFSAIGHGKLRIAQRRLGFAGHRGPQNPDRLVSIRPI